MQHLNMHTHVCAGADPLRAENGKPAADPDGSLANANAISKKLDITSPAAIIGYHIVGRAIDVKITAKSPFSMPLGPYCTSTLGCSLKECAARGFVDTLRSICNDWARSCTIPAGNSDSSNAMWAVGCSHGVVKFRPSPGKPDDKPHWSVNGG